MQRALDWIAVTDHSDGMGTINELQAGNAEFMADPTAKRWAEMMKKGGEEGRAAAKEAISAQSNQKLPKVFMDPKWMVSAWQKTVDIVEKYNEPGTATYTNSIGAPELVGTFTDPSFDPKQRAFYYVRVLEILTPRWTAYDAVRYKVKMSPDVTMTVVERAVTSPIWYGPN